MGKLPENIIAVRKEANLTQEQLAEKLGVAKSTISMYENGKRKPSFEALEALADFFNVNLGVLTGQEVTYSAYEESPVAHRNVVKIAGRDGSYVEKNLSDEQVAALKTLIDQLPEADDL